MAGHGLEADFDLGSIDEIFDLEMSEDINELAVSYLLEDSDEFGYQMTTDGAGIDCVDGLCEINASTSNREALMEVAKALQEENKPPVIVPTAKPRFKSLTEEELRQIEDNKHTKSTKRKTKWGLNILQDWSKEKFGKEIDLLSICPESLNNHLRHFYTEVQPKPPEKENQETEYHKNTMKGIRSALNRHLSDIGRNIDIVKDTEFKQANAALQGKLKHNMQLGLSRPTQHKVVINSTDLKKINSYLDSKVDPIILRYRVWFDLSVHFVSRGLEFHQQLNKQSFIFLKDDSGHEYAALSHETKQKNWQGGLANQEAPYDKRMYATGTESCPVRSLKAFLRKTDEQALSLFNHVAKDAITSPLSKDVWYIAKSVKPYQFTKFMPDISRNAGCSRNYTAHCLRTTAIQALNDDGFEIRHIMFMSGHRNEASVRSYNRDCSTEQKQNLSKALSRVSRPSPTPSEICEKDFSQADPHHPVPFPLQFQPTVATVPANGASSVSNSSFHVSNNTHNRTSSSSMSSSFITNSCFSNCTFNFSNQ